MPASIGDLRGLLMLQCRQAESDSLTGLVEPGNSGLVCTGRVELASAGDFPVLHDRDYYTGKRRKYAGEGIDDDWITAQQNRGHIALTDSGYLAERDWRGLHGILEQTAVRPGPVIALLPLANWWLAEEETVARLAEAIVTFEVPVAVAVEHQRDPFAVRRTLRGALRLADKLEHGPPLLFLRGDSSVLGLLAHGGYAAAVGTRATLRHIYPPGDGGAPGTGFSVYVPSLLTYLRADKVERLVASMTELAQLWECGCAVCCGGTLELLRDPALAMQHSLRAHLEARAQLYRPPRETHTDAELRRRRASIWYEWCSHALYVNDQIAERFPGWEPAKAVWHWYRLGPDPFARRTRTEQIELDTLRFGDAASSPHWT
ncbi:hypothetical protein [Sciscionella sediminilitoris]|uniref:hypothetical protein n=1 Tax=Sciscionella sediminilitoris TaxID=1445613 RepID=UPI0006EB753E|nr:hypothetical protein [Sciscionella sp. SE31]